MNEISEKFALVHFMDTVGNVNHELNIVVKLRFGSNYKRHFC